MLQMNYHVYVRVRPSLNTSDTCLISQSIHKNSIVLSDGKEERQYDTDFLFTEQSSNAQVAQTILPRLLDAVYRSQTAVCLAYGQTGAGKTHTILGTQSEPGVIFSACQQLFNSRIHIAISIVEIYNEQIYDLLNEKYEIKPKNDSSQQLILPNLQQYECDDIHVLHQIIYAAMNVRVTRRTAYNESSSRSHLLLIIRQYENGVPGGELIFGDLAGSENFTDNKSAAGKEGISINKSLLALNNVIINLSKGRQASFRESNLTRLLQRGFLEGVVSVLTNVTKFDYKETRRTLYLAQQTRLIKVQPVAHPLVRAGVSQSETLFLDKYSIYRCVRSVLHYCIDFDDEQLREMLYANSTEEFPDADSDDVNIEIPLARLERIQRFTQLSDAVLYAICEVLPKVKSTGDVPAVKNAPAQLQEPARTQEAPSQTLDTQEQDRVSREQLFRIQRKNAENERLLEAIMAHCQ